MLGATASSLALAGLSLLRGATIKARRSDPNPRHVAVSTRKVQHRNGKWVTITRVFDLRMVKSKEIRKGKPWRHNETTNARRRWLTQELVSGHHALLKGGFTVFDEASDVPSSVWGPDHAAR